MLGSIWSWLGLAAREPEEESPLRELVKALDQLEPERARYLARFAYLLGRVAHADQEVSTKETMAMRLGDIQSAFQFIARYVRF